MDSAGGWLHGGGGEEEGGRETTTTTKTAATVTRDTTAENKNNNNEEYQRFPRISRNGKFQLAVRDDWGILKDPEGSPRRILLENSLGSF